MSLLSEGNAGAILVANLIFQMEQEGIITATLTDKIFEKSIEQAKAIADAAADAVNSASEIKELHVSSYTEAGEIMHDYLDQIQKARNA